MEKEINSAETICDAVVEGMLDKKGEEILIIDLRKFEYAVADFMVLCSGNSDTHINAISDSVEKVLKDKLNEKPYSLEGKSKREWVLLDYVSVVAHVFMRDRRQFFQLENLWGDATITQIDPKTFKPKVS